jgi:hypothetical protein
MDGLTAKRKPKDVTRSVGATVRRPANRRVVVPTATTEHAGGALIRTKRINHKRLTACLFGAHAGRSARDAAIAQVVFFANAQAEVGDAVGSGSFFNKDIGGLDVAMDQPQTVGMMQCLGRGGEPLDDFIKRQYGT